MPIDAPQISQITSKQTFAAIKSTVNELVVVVNGLPATTTGHLGRLGGVVDGLSSGAILSFPTGSLFVVNDGTIAIGDFLDTNQPEVASGKLHIHSATGDSTLYLSQNNASSASVIVLQVANSATWTGTESSEAKTAGLFGAMSNTATQSSVVSFFSANVNHSVAPSTMFDDIADWGSTSDTDSIARFSLVSGDILAIAPHAGPGGHLNAPLRVQRAITYDDDVANTTPMFSALGYSGTPSAIDASPVRLVVGDKTASASHNVSASFAVVDFLGDGADTADADQIKGRIGAQYDTLSGVAGGLTLSVRRAAGDMFSPIRIVGGSAAADEGKIIISNTSIVDSYSKEGITTIADEIGQLNIRQFSHGSKSTDHMGLFIQGSDTAVGEEQIPIIRLENILAQDDSGGAWTSATKKWEISVTGSSSAEGEFRISNLPDPTAAGWSSIANSQFRIAAGGNGSQTDYFFLGNRPSVGAGLAAKDGATLILAGGDASGGAGGGIILDLAKGQIDIGAEQPTTYNIDVQNAVLRLFPLGHTDSGVDDFIYISKPTGANTRLGVGGAGAPAHALHVSRNEEAANVAVEATAGQGAQLRVFNTGSNNYVRLNAIPDNIEFIGSTRENEEDPVSILISRDQASFDLDDIDSDVEAIRISRDVGLLSYGHATHGIGSYVSFRNHQNADVVPYLSDNTGFAWDAVRLVGRTRTLASTDASTADEDGTFEVWLAKDKTPAKKFVLSAAGYMSVGDVPADSPIYNLDIVEDSADIGPSIGFTNETASTDYKTWIIGTDPGLSLCAENPWVLRAVDDRTGTNPPTPGGSGGYALMVDRFDNHVQRVVIGAPTLDNLTSLTVWTAANTDSPNWAGGAQGRVGVANSDPAHTLTVNGSSHATGGIGVYGIAPASRIITEMPNGFTPTTPAAPNRERYLAAADPGVSETEKTWHWGASDGRLWLGQSGLGRIDPLGAIGNDAYSHQDVRVIEFYGNNAVANTVSVADYPKFGRLTGATGSTISAGGRYYGGTEGIDSPNQRDSGSVGINSGGFPMAGGLYVSDHTRLSSLVARQNFASQAPVWDINDTDGLQEVFQSNRRPIPGLYPALVVTSGSPLAAANGAHKVVSIQAGTVGNTYVSPNNVVKKIEAIRRWGEIPFNSAATDNEWHTTAWHDSIGVDTDHAIPIPHTGGSDISFGTVNGQPNGDLTFISTNATRCWWERRPASGGVLGESSVTSEYSESHLFGSQNNHVMTVHANTTYQGLHVEKGGVYANNTILAWARILPRGETADYANNVGGVLGYTGSQGSAQDNEYNSNNAVDLGHMSESLGGGDPFRVGASDNVDTVTELGVGQFMITYGSHKPVGNNYTVALTGTSNIFWNDKLNHAYRKSTMDMDDGGYSIVVDSQTLHNLRFANSTVIGIQTRTSSPLNAGTGSRQGITLWNYVNEDEIHLTVVGPHDADNWRG